MKGDFKQIPLIISFTSNEGAMAVGALASDSFGLNESLDDGVSPTFFKTYLAKFAHARDSR